MHPLCLRGSTFAIILLEGICLARRRNPTLNALRTLQSLVDAHSRLEESWTKLKKTRLISTASWKEDLLPARREISRVIDEAWLRLLERAAGQDYPELIREEDVLENFGISPKTLYRRRKSKELPYIRDNEGVIWYPVFDLLDYLIQSQKKRTPDKPGRPRKF